MTHMNQDLLEHLNEVEIEPAEDGPHGRVLTRGDIRAGTPPPKSSFAGVGTNASVRVSLESNPSCRTAIGAVSPKPAPYAQ
jgi:hypothetical protein